MVETKKGENPREAQISEHLKKEYNVKLIKFDAFSSLIDSKS